MADPEPSTREDWETLKRGPKGFELVDNVRGNGRKKLLVIGKTGTGKSTLCNVIAGLYPNSDCFPVSGAAESCTKTTQLGNILFNGDRERPISIIDTFGFSDPGNHEDVGVISDLVIKLRENCDYVNLFAIVVNGQNPRLDGSLVGMISIFEEMFGNQFWKQVVVIFSRLTMDESNVARRARSSKMTDAEMAEKYLKSVEKRFPNGNGLKYLLMDACYLVDNQDEKECFDKSLSALWDLLEKAPRLETESVQRVETEYDKLKEMIAHQRTQMLEDKELRQRDKEEREKYRNLMKQENEREREQERKEWLKEWEEMKERHRQEQQDLLKSQKSVLELQLKLELNEKDQEQEKLRDNQQKNYEATQEKFEKQLKSLQDQHEALTKQFQQQGDTDQKLRQQIETLERQQQTLTNTHDKEKEKLKTDYKAKIYALEKEKKKISNDFAQRSKTLQEEIEKLKSQTEFQMTAKQLNELEERAKQREISLKKSSTTIRNGWRKKAYDEFIKTEGYHSNKCRPTYGMLKREYPDSHWSVFVILQRIRNGIRDDEYSVMSNGGGEAIERGWEEEAKWRDLVGKDRRWTLYIWRALKSHYGSTLRRGTYEEEKKVYEIIDRLKEKEDRELQSFSDEEKKNFKWSCERLRVELIQQMNHTPQLNNWKHILVSVYAFCYSPQLYSVFFSFSGIYVYICFQS
ncbi:uncharacterized protein LOC142345937 [Convolutriloba macropyga]|uniref:uncharacterized protein LOC142345937 n=1 Tax=Convolutriloba macropyga TaxID=536237 RepID=UPI003F52359F